MSLIYKNILTLRKNFALASKPGFSTLLHKFCGQYCEQGMGAGVKSLIWNKKVLPLKN